MKYWTYESGAARMMVMLEQDTTLRITSMTTSLEASAFRTLNEEWITTLFTLEDADREILGDPVGHVIEPGGDVLIVRDESGEIIGCVALVPYGPAEDGAYELSKMAVRAKSRGQGIGRTLLHATIARAREMGARTLFLGSNSKLVSAVHLYESVGFTHVPPDQIGPMPYVRADVFMLLPL
jgi:putative acetyltransferase